MSKKSNTTKRPARNVCAGRFLDLRRAKLKVCYAYSRLAPKARKVFKDLLQQHATFRFGCNAYVDWGRWNEPDRGSAYLSLLNDASVAVADAWYDWAFCMSLMKMPETARRHMIAEMLTQFIKAESIEEVNAKS